MIPKHSTDESENPPCLRFHPQSKDMYDFHPNCHSFAGGDCGFCYATKVEFVGPIDLPGLEENSSRPARA